MVNTPIPIVRFYFDDRLETLELDKLGEFIASFDHTALLALMDSVRKALTAQRYSVVTTSRVGYPEPVLELMGDQTHVWVGPLDNSPSFIEQIKVLRSVSGWGLKESKDVVDRLRKEPLNYGPSTSVPIQEGVNFLDAIRKLQQVGFKVAVPADYLFPAAP